MTLLLALLASAQAFAAPVTLQGTLKERGTRKPLEGVNVFCIPDKPDGSGPGPAIKAVTDAAGRFSVEAVPQGTFKWVVNLTGYDRLEKYDEQPEGSPGPYVPRDLYLEKASYLAYETTIYDKAQKRDDKTRSVTRDQISKLAGAGNDPIKAVQNLPGVNRVAGFSSQVIIEGSSPQDTLYAIDGMEVPIIFHFGGLSTVVPPESVDRVDLLNSGFGSEYGRTTAGWVSAWLRPPATDRLHGLGFVDIYNVGGILEGPITDRSSFLISARRSYIGAVLKAVAAADEDFDLTVAPEFSDITAIYQHEVTPIDSFRLVAVGSLDELGFLFAEPLRTNPAIRGNFSSTTAFFRLIPELTHRHGPLTTSRWSIGLGKDWIRFDTGANYFHLQNVALSARGEVERIVNPSWKTVIGFDNAYSWADVDLVLPKTFSAGGVSNPFSSAEPRSVSVSQHYNRVGGYWRNELKLGETPWTLIPALRVDYFSQTRQTIPVPRLQTRYRLSDALTLRTAAGLYSQAPRPEETDPSYGNTGLKAIRASHLSVGAQADLRGGTTTGWDVSGDLFYKHLTDLVRPSIALVRGADGNLAPENFTNDGHGRVYGLAAQARYDYRPWSGWISYTLSRSTRWDSSSPEAVYAYDQTHNLAATGSVELPRNWQLSARFRYVTGNPYTPITGGTFDADNDIYLPARGPYFSERTGTFTQLDLRVDKKWVFDSWILSAYLDIQNVTNHENIEALRYSYDYSRTASVAGLPFLPIFGVKGEL